MINVPCAAVGAESQGGGYGFVVGATFGCAGFGLLAFRMCHCCLVLYEFLFVYVVAVGKFSQSIPTWVGSLTAGCVYIVYFIDKVVLQLTVFVGRGGTVLLEQGTHLAVALAHGVHMLDGDCKLHCIVEHVSYIERGITHRDFKHVIAVVVIAVAILDNNMICRFDGEMEVVETTVADECHFSLDGEVKVVVLTVICHCKMRVKGGIVDIGALHIYEELLVEAEIKFVLSDAETLKWQIIC